jgi:Anaerobic glycerol-3-phosphate dehydrogenase
MKPTDVLVAGSGMAGMVAALAVAAGGKSVRLVARGAGALAVGGGQVDLLGYTASGIVRGNPLDAIGHPARIASLYTDRSAGRAGCPGLFPEHLRAARA